jgi:hypothetical protein
VIVRFAPTGASAHSGSVSITHNGTNASSPLVVPLSGTGASNHFELRQCEPVQYCLWNSDS